MSDLRIFAITNDPEWARQLAHDVGHAGCAIEVSSDPRRIKAFIHAGPVQAVLIDARVGAPGPDTLARALRKAVGPAHVIAQLTEALVAQAPDAPFDFSVRYPVHARVLLDRIRRTLRAYEASNADVRDVLAEIEVRCARMDDQDHFQLLGITPTASIDAMTRAYDELSLALHPDRLRAIKDEAIRARASRLYAAMTEAYRTLKDPAARQRYLQQRDRGGRGVRDTRARATITLALDEYSDNPNVKKYLRLAQIAINGDDTALALVHLRFAATLDPENKLIAAKVRDLEP